MIINTQTVKKTSGGNNNYSVLGGILDDHELIYPSTKTPQGIILSNNPADYTKVDWCENVNKQVVHTNYMPLVTHKGYAEYEITDEQNSTELWPSLGLIQTFANGTGKQFGIPTYTRADMKHLGYSTSGLLYKTHFQAKTSGQTNVISIEDNVVTATFYNSWSGSASFQKTLSLFARNNNEDAVDYCTGKGRLHIYQITDENDVFIHNYIPSYHTESRITGYFDSVDLQFLACDGLGIPSDTSGEINLAEYLASLT